MGFYYLCENKCADQLCVYCAADLRLYFCKEVFHDAAHLMIIKDYFCQYSINT